VERGVTRDPNCADILFVWLKRVRML
jgi:hypothetical protein